MSYSCSVPKDLIVIICPSGEMSYLHSNLKPDVWEKHIDMHSNESFYHNPISGETCWERPFPERSEQTGVPDSDRNMQTDFKLITSFRFDHALVKKEENADIRFLNYLNTELRKSTQLKDFYFTLTGEQEQKNNGKEKFIYLLKLSCLLRFNSLTKLELKVFNLAEHQKKIVWKSVAQTPNLQNFILTLYGKDEDINIGVQFMETLNPKESLKLSLEYRSNPRDMYILYKNIELVSQVNCVIMNKPEAEIKLTSSRQTQQILDCIFTEYETYLKNLISITPPELIYADYSFRKNVSIKYLKKL